MSNTIKDLEQTIPTIQVFPGPNRTLAGSKSVTCSVDVEVQGANPDLPAQYKYIKVEGYYDLATGTEYAGSFLDKAAIGSEYKELVVTAGAVTDCKMWLKRANAGANTDWKLATYA